MQQNSEGSKQKCLARSLNALPIPTTSEASEFTQEKMKYLRKILRAINMFVCRLELIHKHFELFSIFLINK